jgi:hypothetical protein
VPIDGDTVDSETWDEDVIDSGTLDDDVDDRSVKGVRMDEETYDGFEGVEWRRSSFDPSDGAAVEIAFLDHGHVAMRNSEQPDTPALVFTPDEWTAFLDGVGNHEFDRPRSEKSGT